MLFASVVVFFKRDFFLYLRFKSIRKSAQIVHFNIFFAGVFSFLKVFRSSRGDSCYIWPKCLEYFAVAHPFLFSFVIDVGRDSQTPKKVSFEYFWLVFSQNLGQVRAWLSLDLTEMVRVSFSVAYPTVIFSFLIDVGREEFSNLWKIVFLSIFNHCDPRPQNFGQTRA